LNTCTDSLVERPLYFIRYKCVCLPLTSTNFVAFPMHGNEWCVLILFYRVCVTPHLYRRRSKHDSGVFLP
jgi:hypothetical protein